jgi:hypothetical protein
VKKPHHFEVWGTGRDYDYTPFCSAHYLTALEVAKDWIEEQHDRIAPGEECEVKIRCIEGTIPDDDECAACAETKPAEGGAE